MDDDPLQDVRDRIRSGAVRRDFRRFRIDLQGLPDHHRAQVKRPNLGGRDRDDRQLRPLVRPSQVDLPRRIAQRRPNTRPNERAPNLRSRRTARAVELFLTSVRPGPRPRRSDRRIGAERNSADLANHSLRQLHREAAELLFGVVAGEAGDEGRVATRRVVVGASGEPWTERRRPLGQGAPFGPWSIVNELVLVMISLGSGLPDPSHAKA